MADFELAAGDDVRIRITGLRAVLKSAQDAGASADDLKEAMAQVAGLVVDAARPLARRESGDMAASIRAGRAKNRARVLAGSARVPYAGPQHYGWTARGISPNPFLTDALTRKRVEVLAELDRQIGRLLTSAGLEPD